FISSRRRHTRFSRDWSSDVCSSDLVAGTCMNAGKTVAATELVRGLSRGGLRVAALKLTGVSLMRDALSMRDAGAVAAFTFNDARSEERRVGKECSAGV